MGTKLSTPVMDLIRADPLSNLLINKLKMTPIRIALVMFVLACIWRLVIPLSSGRFSHSPMKFPPSLDGIFLSFIEVPFFWGYFIWSKKQLAILFTSVLDNNLLKAQADKGQYKNFLKDLSSVFAMKKIYVFTAGIALLLTAVQVLYFYPGNTDIWYEPYQHPLYAAGEMLIYTFSQYIVVTLILTELIVIGRLKKFFDNYNIKVHFDFPDRSGGWGEIGRHALGASSFAVIFGIWLTGMTISAEAQFAFPVPIKAFFWFLFSLLAPIGFIAPLLSAHGAMEKYKLGVLRDVSEHINNLFDSSKDSIGSPEFNRKGVLTVINELREWYGYLDKTIPVWPFPIASFPGIASTWFLPLVSGLITSYVQEYIKKFF